MNYRRQPNIWTLRIATLLFVLGTAQFVARDIFHADDSIVQPIIEVSSVIVGSCLSLGACLAYRSGFRLRAPYLLLFAALLLSIVFSLRSWNPLLSVSRGVLLILMSVSAVALLHCYGPVALMQRLLNAYFILVLAGLIAGFAAPDRFPLMLHDPGEEAVRSRLHLFKIHPIALADDCAICLLFSVLLPGRRMLLYRAAFVTCLLLTVTRASIVLCLPLYMVAEFVFARDTRKGFRRLAAVGATVLVTIGVALSLALAFSDGSAVDEIQATIVHVVDATKNNVTLNGRTDLWSVLVDDLSFDNIYGYGVAGARYYLRSVNPWFSHSHNSGLETIYMSGYLGLALVVGALFGSSAALVKYWQHPEVRVFTVVLFYVVAVGMMNPSWYETSSLMVLSIACNGPWLPARPRTASPRLGRSYLAGAPALS